MKSINKKERAYSKIKFFAAYGVTVLLIVVLLSAFWNSTGEAQKIIIEDKQQPKEIIKTVEVKIPEKTGNQALKDSFNSAIILANANIAALTKSYNSQKNTVAQLQAQLKNAPTSKNDDSEIAKLNKQIEFLDWAVRSQVAITNTLTKENNTLKAKLAASGK